MPLHFSRPHPQALHALEEGLKILNQDDSKGVHSILQGFAVLNAGSIDDRVSHETAGDIFSYIHNEQSHHKIFLVSIQDIISDNGFDKAKLIGWRYIAHGKAYEVHCDENCENHRLGHVNEGPHIQGLFEALNSIENHHRVQSDTFEVSIISIPEVYMTALWLQRQDGENHLFIPIEPTFLPEVQSGEKIFTETELIQVLKKEANNMLEFDDAPDVDLTE